MMTRESTSLSLRFSFFLTYVLSSSGGRSQTISVISEYGDSRDNGIWLFSELIQKKEEEIFNDSEGHWRHNISV
jgi:hypothetical protein